MDKVWNQQEFEEMMLIENYLRNKLSEEDKFKLEQRIAEDPEFAEEVENERLFLEGVMAVHRDYLEKTVRTWATEGAVKNIPSRPAFNLFVTKPDRKEGQNPSKQKQSKINYRLVAAVALMIGLSFVTFSIFQSQQNSTRKIYEREYRSMRMDAGQIQQRSGSELKKDTKNLRQEAFTYYYKKNYAEAAKIFSRIEADEISLFYLAMCKMELEDFEGAANKLNLYLSTHQTYALEAKWYLALSQLRLEKVEEAKRLFSELSEQNNKYRESAQRITQSLD